MTRTLTLVLIGLALAVGLVAGQMLPRGTEVVAEPTAAAALALTDRDRGDLIIGCYGSFSSVDLRLVRDCLERLSQLGITEASRPLEFGPR